MIVMLVAVAPLVKADSSDQSTSPAAVPGLRTMRYTSRPASQALAWQIELRGKLSRLMKIDDLLNSGSTISFDAKVLEQNATVRIHVRPRVLDFSSRFENVWNYFV